MKDTNSNKLQGTYGYYTVQLMTALFRTYEVNLSEEQRNKDATHKVINDIAIAMVPPMVEAKIAMKMGIIERKDVMVGINWELEELQTVADNLFTPAMIAAFTARFNAGEIDYLSKEFALDFILEQIGEIHSSMTKAVKMYSKMKLSGNTSATVQ